MPTTRTIRLFISSTFSDFIPERQALMERVFPRLQDYCAARGARFQAVDLRWGITEAAQQDHETMRICLEEVRRSQMLSPRPNFAVLLGDRYGWEPLPARVTEDHFKRLMAAATPEDRRALREAYSARTDRNAVPALRWLKPRSGDAQRQARLEARALQALRRAAQAAGIEGAHAIPYGTSATHQEIVLGALEAADADQHVHVYVRQIQGLPQDARASAYTDWDAQSARPVEGARERLQVLEGRLRERLPERVHTVTATWRDDGVTQDHLGAFCEQFHADQLALIERELATLEAEDDVATRSREHATFARERARNFVGRKTLLARVSRYLAPGAAPAPVLVICGAGGSGKSALMARAWDSLKETSAPGGYPCHALVRFIGALPGTESLVSLLGGLAQDIARAYGAQAPELGDTADAVQAAFLQSLALASEQAPLVLMLDALDQLDEADAAWRLDWLPQVLPAHVRVVVTTRPGPTQQAALRRWPRRVLQVPAMTPAEGASMLDAWLASSREARFNAGTAPSLGRRLTRPQRRQLLEAFARHGKPLWLKLAYEEASQWPSWHPGRDMPDTVEALVSDLVHRRLVQSEGHPLVFAHRALAYIAASRWGMAEDELALALGTDPQVREEFGQQEKSQSKWEHPTLLPPILWSRLFFDLQPYLSQVRIDGAVVYRFFHREFDDAIRRAFLQTPEDRRRTHSHLAQVFGQLAPAGDALYRQTDARNPRADSRALRRIMEQPWQLARAGDYEGLSRLLTDFGFCMAKCAGNRSADLLRDYHALPPQQVRGDARLGVWSRFMRGASHLLHRGDTTWPAHRILLQLALEHADDSPLTLGAESWMAQGLCDWSYAQKLMRPARIPETGVQWVGADSPHLRDYRDFCGIHVDGDRLWTWDSHHLRTWNPEDASLANKVSLGQIELLLATPGRFLVAGKKRPTCAAYDGHSGLLLWELTLPEPVRTLEQLDDDRLIAVDRRVTRIISLATGAVLEVVSHAVCASPRAHWGDRLSVHALGGRWLVYLDAPDLDRVPAPRHRKAVLSVYSLQERKISERHECVLTDDSRITDTESSYLMDGISGQWVVRVGRSLLVHVGQWLYLDADQARIQALEPALRAQLDVATSAEPMVPFALGSRYLVFRVRDSLLAWCMATGVVHTHELPQGLWFARHFLDADRLALVVRSNVADKVQERSDAVWNLTRQTLQPLAVPSIESPVILAARGDTLIVSRDYAFDSDEGDRAQPEPLVSIDVVSGRARVIHTMDRVVDHTKRFVHTWRDDRTLLVLDGADLTCLSTDEGPAWEDHVDTSLGTRVTVTEDWHDGRRFAITGTRQVLHVDLSGTPTARPMAHGFDMGAVAELLGDELLMWMDVNGLYESGGPGSFKLHRRDAGGQWAPDEGSTMMTLSVASPGFDPWPTFSVTRCGDLFLVCQGNRIHSFRPNADRLKDEVSVDSYILVDSLTGPEITNPYWVRANTLYFPDPEDDDRWHACELTEGAFGPLRPVARSDVFEAGETMHVNVRPYRDMATGPIRDARLFMTSEEAGTWTAYDGACWPGSPTAHVSFDSESAGTVRWFGRKPCRLVPHRMSYPLLGERDFFAGQLEDLHSVCVDDRLFFVCEADGTASVLQVNAVPEADG